MNRTQRRQLARAERRGIRPDRNAARAVPAVFVEPILYSTVYSEEQAAEICNAARMAWYRITTGDGTLDDFELVADVCNQMLVIAEGLGDELVAEILAAQAALIAMKARYLKTTRLAPDAATLREVANLLDRYTETLIVSTARQMINASKEARRRILVRMVETGEEA